MTAKVARITLFPLGYDTVSEAEGDQIVIDMVMNTETRRAVGRMASFGVNGPVGKVETCSFQYLSSNELDWGNTADDDKPPRHDKTDFNLRDREIKVEGTAVYNHEGEEWIYVIREVLDVVETAVQGRKVMI